MVNKTENNFYFDIFILIPTMFYFITLILMPQQLNIGFFGSFIIQKEVIIIASFYVLILGIIFYALSKNRALFKPSSAQYRWANVLGYLLILAGFTGLPYIGVFSWFGFAMLAYGKPSKLSLITLIVCILFQLIWGSRGYTVGFVLLLISERQIYLDRTKRLLVVVLAIPFIVYVMQALSTDARLSDLLAIGPIYIIQHIQPMFVAHQEAYTLDIGLCRLAGLSPGIGVLLNGLGDTCNIIDLTSRNINQEALESGTRLGSSSVLHAKYFIDHVIFLLFVILLFILKRKSYLLSRALFYNIIFLSPYLIRRSVASYMYDLIGVLIAALILAIIYVLLPKKRRYSTI